MSRPLEPTSFRDRLLATLRAIAPILEVPGVTVVGSEVPNLLEPGAAATLVVSQDVDVAIPVSRRDEVKALLGGLRGLHPSPTEPSVWLPDGPDLIEVNFLGLDEAVAADAAETYLLDDPELPLMVFGLLSLVRRSTLIAVDGLRVPVASVPGLMLEKLASDRTADKGDRDLLVALGLVMVASESDHEEMLRIFVDLPAETRHAVRSGAAMLSLIGPRPGMPDPRPERERVAQLLATLEAAEHGA